MRPLQGVVLLAAVSLVGCGATVSATRISGPFQPRPDDAEISVSSVTVPQCPFEEVGIVTARRQTWLFNPDLLDVLRREARKMGGDALVGLSQVAPIPDHSGSGLSATVIRFTDPSCRA